MKFWGEPMINIKHQEFLFTLNPNFTNISL